MEELLTDQQQAEKVRSWVRENGIFLVAGWSSASAGCLAGINGVLYQERQAEEASAVYETFLQSVRANQVEQAESGMAALATEHGSSPYTDQAPAGHGAPVPRPGQTRARSRGIAEGG